MSHNRTNDAPSTSQDRDFHPCGFPMWPGGLTCTSPADHPGRHWGAALRWAYTYCWQPTGDRTLVCILPQGHEPTETCAGQTQGKP